MRFKGKSSKWFYGIMIFVNDDSLLIAFGFIKVRILYSDIEKLVQQKTLRPLWRHRLIELKPT